MQRLLVVVLALKVVGVIGDAQERFNSAGLLTSHPDDEQRELFLNQNIILVADDTVKDEETIRPVGTEYAGFTVYGVSRKYLDDHYEAGLSTICLKMGTPVDFVDDFYEGSVHPFGDAALYSWFQDNCAKVEVGIVSFIDEALKLYWISPQGKEEFTGDIHYGEPKTAWRSTFIGHKFIIRPDDPASDFEPVEFQIKSDMFRRLGEQESIIGSREEPTAAEYQRAHNHEIQRSKRIKKTFTSTGYQRVPVPRKLWGSIRYFWNNNREEQNTFAELWKGRGVFINYWKAEPRMSIVPFGLKKGWHQMMQPVLEAWSNTKLEPTDIYGIRVYYSGAELIDHVDRHETHAVSAIINVEQAGMNSDWELEIYNIDGDIIHSDLQRGEAMLYESAKCMHGRPKALDGDFYANVFFHYRPIGNPNWWREQSSHSEL